MKILIFLTLAFASFFMEAWAAPPKKISGSQNVVVQESYSVAQTGMETETLRIQQVLFNGKKMYFVSKLVNGNLFLEKPSNANDFSRLKNLVRPLVAMPGSDLCQTPVTVISINAGKERKSKVCHEKSEVSEMVADFTLETKALLEAK